VSSIPCAGDSPKWKCSVVLQRAGEKGWGDPEEHVQIMVDIRSFLNEETRAGDSEVGTSVRPSYLSIALQVKYYDYRPSGTRTRTLPSSEEDSASYHRKLVYSLQTAPSLIRPTRLDRPLSRYRRGSSPMCHRLLFRPSPPPDGSPMFGLDVRPAFDSIAGVQACVSGWKLTWSDAATRENQA